MSPDLAAPLGTARWLRHADSRRVLAALQAGGRAARFVGGCVRDTLLDAGLDPHDLDIATQEPPARAIELLEAAGLRVVPTGIEHGTITAIAEHHAYEITTLRRDVSTDGRRATVAFTDDFVADAARRDFTINAMSCDGDGRLFDPFDGLADLLAGRIRFVGEPRQRIREDYLRILRWFRFFARFGREPPDGEALAACAAEVAGIGRLSGERLQHEMLKLLVQPGAVRALGLMRDTGVLAAVLGAAVDVDAVAALRRVGVGCDPVLALAAMVRGVAIPGAAAQIAERLKLSRADSLRLTALASAPLPDATASLQQQRRWVDELGAAEHRDRLRLAAAEAGLDPAQLAGLEAELALQPPPNFPVSGNDVLAAGVAMGPAVGRILGDVRSWWRGADFLPDRAACLARINQLAKRSG